MADDTCGYRGRITSLAGVMGREGLGLQVKASLVDAALLTAPHFALNANPGRVWALISNEGALPVYCGFGIDLPNATFHSIQPHGNLLINKDLPWVGRVAVVSTGTCAVRTTEASIQE